MIVGLEINIKKNVLPIFSEPDSLNSAVLAINQLGRNLHEHAYIVGKLLLWVKPQVGHGGFEQWVENNVWFSPITARRFMRYSNSCDEKATLLEYHPKLLTQNNHGDCFAIPQPPIGTYQVIVIDPPWPYGGSYDPDTHRVASPYREMSIEALKELHIPSAPDCVLWLWVTNAFMHDAYHLLEAWGFEPHTILTWDKQRVGVGYYLRGQTEHCILATRGKPIITHSAQSTLISVKATSHSTKPDEFYKLVESLCVGNKLDMFARREREGWEVWGNEV